jgi:uncharacterized protein YndB with AHSA1/START domain
MADVETTITITAPIESVLDQWAEGRRYNEWQPAATKKDVHLVTSSGIGPGARFRGTFKGAGELEYEIVDYQRPHLLAMRTVTKMGELRHTIRCEETPGSRRVSQFGEARFRGVYKLAGPLILMVFRRSFRQNDQALKRILEGSTSAVAARGGDRRAAVARGGFGRLRPRWSVVRSEARTLPLAAPVCQLLMMDGFATRPCPLRAPHDHWRQHRRHESEDAAGHVQPAVAGVHAQPPMER